MQVQTTLIFVNFTTLRTIIAITNSTYKHKNIWLFIYIICYIHKPLITKVYNEFKKKILCYKDNHIYKYNDKTCNN